MTPYDFKKMLSFLRKMEKEITQETFILLYGQRGLILWEEYRNFDYSLNLLHDCMKPEDCDILDVYLAANFQKQTPPKP
jgi:hypothetical protein